MTEQPSQPYYEEVIDLRELIQILWDAKWIILGVTLASALAAFLVSSYLLSPRYEAEAYITLLEPGLKVELETSIQSGELRLDSSGLPNLAQSAAVRERVFQELEITDQDQRGDFEFAASLLGGDQLQLQVTARDPELAAGAANTWAAMVVETLNELYGEGESSEQVLAAEVQRAREQWQSAQETLEDYYPRNQVESLRVELAAAKSRLALYQARVDQIRLLQIDLKGLSSQLEQVPAGSLISTSRYLALIALQQRAVQVSSASYYQSLQILEINPQINQEAISDGVQSQSGSVELNFPDSDFSAVSAASARAELEALGAALEAVEKEVLALSQETAAEINQLRVDLELEEYQLAELTEERDLARSVYTALRGQLEENRITRSQQDNVVRIAADAVEPKQPSGPRTMLNTALAGLVGGMLAVAGVLVVNWWSADEGEQ